MTDRPILFKDHMVRALLAGTKTQTRRILKPQPQPDMGLIGLYAPGLTAVFGYQSPGDDHKVRLKFMPKDRLWVRETWSGANAFKDVKPSDRESFSTPDGPVLREDIWYWADGSPYGGDYEKPRVSIHMPRWASRITLIVTDVRVERLQDISESDAVAEGVEQDSDGWQDYMMPHTQCCATAKDSYRTLWDSINAKSGFGWNENPWVAAYTFTVLKQNIDKVQQ